jgi:transposase
MQGVRVERLDHLGIVAGICREIGLAAYLYALAGPTQQQVSVGTATVAMILNGLGFSNRRLYLVSQFFATKPVEHLLGAGMTAEMLHDDCLGRTLDWLHAHDPTALFAGIARQARERFGIVALSLVMVLRLLVYRLAEHRLRAQLAATGQTVPNQLKQPTDRPTMRWVFQCFEGIDLLHLRHGPEPALALALRLQPIHQQVLALLGPSYEQFYTSTN